MLHISYNSGMLTPVLTTKLYIPPPRPKIVRRAHLIDRLNDGLRAGCKVVLISAPAGFGKTSLISEWVSTFTAARHPLDEASRVKVAWLSLDEGDSDLARFLTYFVAAVQTIAPQRGEHTLTLLQTAQPLDRVLTTLLNELATLADQFVLVLDDYHTLDCRPIDEALTFLIDHLPPHVQLVITTREDPPFPLARLRARGQLTELRAADLRFTPAEAAAFLNDVMGLRLTASDIVALESRTEGWIAGLQLAALALQGPLAAPGRSAAASFIGSFTGGHHFVLDYLLKEVLQQQSADVLTFLLHTSMLHRLCGPLCEAVAALPTGAGQTMLEYLERANLFSVPLDGERQWYRYHRLFADLLQQRLRQTEPDLAVYHRRASHWYADHGFMAEAFQHAIAAQDPAQAATVAERAWPSMDGTFQTAAWLGWIKQLPQDLIRRRPVLCAQIGWAFMDAGDPAASEAALQNAERGLSDRSVETESVAAEQLRLLPAQIAMARAHNAQVQGDLAATVQQSALALHLLPAEDVFRRAQATVLLNFTHWATGELEAARQSIVDWQTTMQHAGNVVFAVASAFAAADILIEQGRLREASRTYQQALQLADEAGAEAQAITAHHHLGLALLYHETGHAAAFTAHWSQAEELGQRTTLVDWPYRWRLAQARIKQADGDFDAALELLAEAQRVYVKNPVPILRPIEALKAQLYLKQGRISQAQAWAQARALAVDDELNYLTEFDYLTLARVLIATDRASHAVRLLDRLLLAAETGQRTGSVIALLIVQALAWHAHGNRPAALAALERALTLAEPEGYVRVFVDEGEPLHMLILDFGRWLEKQTRGEDRQLIGYVEKLLAAFPQPIALPQSAVSHQPADMLDSLSPRELEVLRLIEQGLSNQAIADRLFLAVSTVKGYTRTLFDKLHVQRRTEAVARARELGLL